MTTARMAVAKGTLDDDLRLAQILFLPTGSYPGADPAPELIYAFPDLLTSYCHHYPFCEYRSLLQTFVFDNFPFYTKKEITSATKNPVPPTSVSMIVQVFKVVFSSTPIRDLTSQKPESLK